MRGFTIAPKAEGGESFPVDVAGRLLAGENPVRVYRNHRGMKQGDLAAAGVHPVYLSQIETGRRTGSTRTLAAIAEALGVTVDDLI
ncbi:MAG: helix-turn-helix transcriptional regulator [Nitrospinae bacterium]|nr:helix-turn-helix transcriptional regulator [Nitrospinota bacterium]